MPTLARLTTAALLITLTACANQPAAPPAPPSAATAAPAATPTAATPTAPPTPTPSTPTPAASPQTAADGNDLAACKDADCEVEIRAGDRLTIDERFGLQRLTISSLNADEAVLTLLGSTGGLRAEGMSVSVSGTCVNGRCRDEGKLTLTPHSPGRINSIRLELPYLTDDHAILRLTRK
ncbi:hypothetical protein [Nonomuraea turcica]|uniref:hypothetical protein n=1 Tax=Nonomuraea sp. G32 TaxID=3067274 RepID=UPI00273B569F|nr:hypothetical protein [Nonomuraea sp. G32]MDP4502369.1 hypothetical protein [Nonomuraea sp. G32]